MSQFTRSGTRRTGDDYQDVVGAELLIEQLEHPGRYKWIEFEAIGVGALDNVVACRHDGKRIYRQVKYANHPESGSGAISWEYLLKKSDKDGATCFLEKWLAGFKKAASLGEMHEASLVTNRPPDVEFKGCLKGPPYLLAGRPVLASAKGVKRPHDEFFQAVSELGLSPYCTNLAKQCR